MPDLEVHVERDRTTGLAANTVKGPIDDINPDVCVAGSLPLLLLLLLLWSSGTPVTALAGIGKGGVKSTVGCVTTKSMWIRNEIHLWQLSTSDRLPLHACYRSLLVYTRSGQSEHRVPPARHINTRLRSPLTLNVSTGCNTEASVTNTLIKIH